MLRTLGKLGVVMIISNTNAREKMKTGESGKLTDQLAWCLQWQTTRKSASNKIESKD